MDKKIKLYQINTIANSGSVGRIAEGISILANSNSFECCIAYGRWANPSKFQQYKIGSLFETYAHVLITRFFDRHGLGSKHATKQLIKHIKQENPDIIHLHNIHGYYLNYPLLFNFLKEYNVPVVWTLHDCWSYTGHCVHYSAANCNQWRFGCQHCPNLSEYPSSLWLDASSYNYAMKKKWFNAIPNMTIVTVSHWLEKQVRNSFLSNYPIHTIYNGLNPQTFHPTLVKKEKWGWSNKFIILGVATQLTDRKGLNDFVTLSKHISEDTLIVLVGLSKKAIRSLPSNIIGFEKTENIQELVELYSVADIFLNLSVEETFGMTSVESMACGTPVLVYNSTACPEIINSNVGFVVEPHDINHILSIIKSIKKTGKKYYSSACRSYVLKNFIDIEKYSEYISLYKDILNRASAKSKKI